jgi:molybdopterin converting factor small subunit
MNIQVQYVAQMRTAAGTAQETFILEDGAHADALLRQIADVHGDRMSGMLFDCDGAVRPSVLVFVGDDQVGNLSGHALSERDAVTVLAPLAGG